MANNNADEIRKELRMVADYLHYDDIDYGISAKGWMYATVYNKDGVTRHLNYYETHEHEYVYQETKNGYCLLAKVFPFTISQPCNRLNVFSFLRSDISIIGRI